MKGHSFSLDHEYETQSIQWIRSLKVNELADKNCCLFMWIVSPMLDLAFETITSWGFKYKTLAFCWSKIHKSGKLVSNLGRWTMGNVELCLLATKGKPQRIIKNIKQLVVAERTQHSKKPDEVRNRIVELMGDIPRIELFARQRFPGWYAWGNELEPSNKVEEEVYKILGNNEDLFYEKQAEEINNNINSYLNRIEFELN